MIKKATKLVLSLGIITLSLLTGLFVFIAGITYVNGTKMIVGVLLFLIAIYSLKNYK